MIQKNNLSHQEKMSAYFLPFTNLPITNLWMLKKLPDTVFFAEGVKNMPEGRHFHF
jgi:hypothetical protein